MSKLMKGMVLGIIVLVGATLSLGIQVHFLEDELAGRKSQIRHVVSLLGKYECVGVIKEQSEEIFIPTYYLEAPEVPVIIGITEKGVVSRYESWSRKSFLGRMFPGLKSRLL